MDCNIKDNVEVEGFRLCFINNNIFTFKPWKYKIRMSMR